MREPERVFGRVVFALLVLGLAACSTATPPPSGLVAATITFKHLPPLRVDVARIEVVEAWQQPGTAPNVGHFHKNSPPQIFRAWARDRLIAVPGGAGAREGSVLRMVLRDGAVVRKALAVREGVGGLFRDEADTNIEAICAVEVELVDPKVGRTAGITVEVTGSRNILESANLNERDELYFALMEEIAAALNTELENGIRAELGFLLTR